ncbi:hypothetical protein D1871_14340 [Nakamurella silvestris]|nr:hypothetical protein D1871_14340 [Nakamurella silvestris]
MFTHRGGVRRVVVGTLVVIGHLPVTNHAAAEFPPSTPSDALPFASTWGNNANGQIGDATIQERHVPVLSTGGAALDGKEITQVSAGAYNTCAIAEGSLYCWGTDVNGELGNGTTDAAPTTSPLLVGPPLAGKFVTEVSVGKNHVCAVADGAAYCWGNNFYGQLGDTTHADRTTPTAVYTGGYLAGRTVTAIAAGSRHTCALADGLAFCWGRNGSGALGNSDFPAADQFAPVPVRTSGPLNGLILDSIAVGDNHSCVTGRGHAYCWGENLYGQLGIGDGSTATDPQAVVTTGGPAGKSVFALSAGGANTCAVIGFADTRSAYCWGDNSLGQVGDNTKKSRNIPTRVALAGTATSISVSRYGGCAIVDGTTRCWGDNTHGRIGNNTTTHAVHPETVNQNGVLKNRRELQVSAGDSFTSALAVLEPEFGDVAPGDAFYDDIEWIAGTGTSTGYPGSPTATYHPLDTIQRQAMAAFLFRSTHPGVTDPICAGKDADRLFHDVHTADLFCGDVEWLVHAGITTVPVSGLFTPTGDTNRAVLAAWLFRARHPGTPGSACAGDVFTDVSNSGNTKTAECGDIEWLAGAGLTTGYQDGSFHPKDPVRRDAMAVFLHRADLLTSH